MPVHGLTPILMCLLPVWMILTPVSSHPRLSQCRLIQQTALCNNARLSSVPSGLPRNIEELQLNYNHMQTLQDSALLTYPSLNSLSLACNSLEKLETNTFRDSKLLESLNLANNRLSMGYSETSQALKKLLSLKALDLSENNLKDEMAASLLQNLTSLEYLNLSGNLLQRLDETSFRDLHQLKELDLQRNVMFEMDGAFAGNPKLQRLNLAFNYLPCLTGFDMIQLVVLNASHNFIEWFISRQDLNDTFRLETLDLSDNKLLFFPFLPSRSHLRNLYLAHNSLRFYERLADNSMFPNSTKTVQFYNMKAHTNLTAQLWDDGLHGDVSSLNILDLRGNQVEYFPRGFIQKMSGLSRLRMCLNCLKSLNLTSEQFSGSLYELDLSNNRLNQIAANNETLTTLGNLTYFNLSQNNLEGLPPRFFSSLPSLRSVDLSYNNVDICFAEETGISENVSTCVDLKNVVHLEQLYLKGCKLGIIPSSAFAGLSLTHLELSDNPGLNVQQSIHSLSRTLQHLGIANTHTRIQDFDFSRFKLLNFLNISKNWLASLHPSLVHLDLKVLDLRDNRLSTIPSGLANALAPKLQLVFLTGNPFNCCQTEWFRTFETIETMDMVGLSDIECNDLFQTTHRMQHLQSSVCLDNSGESIFWYLLLFVPLCFSFIGISIIVLLTFKPKTLQKSIKKKCLRRTPY